MSTQSDASALLRLIPLNAVVLEVWFFGLNTCFTAYIAWHIVSYARFSKRTFLLSVLLGIVYGCATIHSALGWWETMSSIIDFGTTPQLPVILTRQPVWYKAFGATVFSVIVLIADGMFMWRCWIIWNRRWMVIVLPFLATIAGTVMAVLAIIGQVLATRDRVPGTLVRKLVTYGTPYFSLSLGTSLYTTLLIAARVGILLRNGDLYRVKVFGDQDPSIQRPQGHITLAKILLLVVPIESALIYSVNLIAFVALLARSSLKADYPQDLHPQITGIAINLIILRAVMEDSRRRKGMEDTSISESDFPRLADEKHSEV